MDTKNERVMTTEELINFINNQKNEFFIQVSLNGCFSGRTEDISEVNSDDD